MPQKGLSRFRLKEHFRKYTAIYIAGLIVCVLLTNIIYTTTEPRTPYEREVLVYLVDYFTDPEAVGDLPERALEYGRQFDETLEEVRFEPIAFSDPEKDYSSSMLLMTRLSLGEGDIFFASAKGAESIFRSEVCESLQPHLDEGWMEGLDLEPVPYTLTETGETIVAGLRLDNVPGLADRLIMENEGAVMIIAFNSTNMETTLRTAEFIIRDLMEESHAPAQSEEPAA